MVPRFSDQEIENGLTDFNDQANQSPAEAAAVTGQLTLAIENAAPFALDPERDALLAEGAEGLTPDMSDEEAAAYRARLPANV